MSEIETSASVIDELAVDMADWADSFDAHDRRVGTLKVNQTGGGAVILRDTARVLRALAAWRAAAAKETPDDR